MRFKIAQKSFLTHLAFVSLFLIVPTLAFVRRPDESLLTVNKVIIQDALANFILLCFFYLNYYILIPKFYFTRKYILYVLFIVLFLSISFPLSHLIANLFPGVGHHNTPPFGLQPAHNFPPRGNRSFGGEPPFGHLPLPEFSFYEFRRHLYLFFTAVFFSFLLRERERLSQLKEEKLGAELTSLRAQINPHFLFNTLNSIYSLSIKKDEKLPAAIIQLSGIMRYAITDAKDARIPLQKEIDYIDNYIELQKARTGNTAVITYTCTGNPAGKEIAPLLLITYIENACKHGINPDANNCTVVIRMEITGSGLQLHTFNQKVQALHPAETTGIGMRNTKERLEHLYPNRFSIQVHETRETYSLTLSIDLA